MNGDAIMSIALLVGTDKGGMIFQADDQRQSWVQGDLAFRGWRVTAAARDSTGRFYVAVAGEIFGCALLYSDNLEDWTHLEAAPRYKPGLPGHHGHNRTIPFNEDEVADSVTPDNPLGLYAYRHVDQIWTLYCADDALYAGVSEAGLFRSHDQGQSWESVDALNHHESQPGWQVAFGGLTLHSILGDEKNPARMWVGISAAGVFRTENAGLTWQRKNQGVSAGADGDHCVHGLANDPASADVIYRQEHGGMYKSMDGGDNWALTDEGLPKGVLSMNDRPAVFGFPVELDPASGYVYSFPLQGDDFRYPPNGMVRTYRSRDGAKHWEMLDKGMPSEPRYTNVLRGAMSLDSLDPCGVYIGTTSGNVFLSADKGDSWLELPVTLPKILCVEAFML